jgi:hypothetical protein
MSNGLPDASGDILNWHNPRTSVALLAAIVIDPEAFVTVIPVPAVIAAAVYVVPLPIGI